MGQDFTKFHTQGEDDTPYTCTGADPGCCIGGGHHNNHKIVSINFYIITLLLNKPKLYV